MSEEEIERELAICRAALGISTGEKIPPQEPQHGSVLVDIGSSRKRVSPVNDEVVRLNEELALERQARERAEEKLEEISEAFPDDAPHKHDCTGYSLLDDVRDTLRDSATWKAAVTVANHNLDSALAQVASLRDAMPSVRKLKLLADWIDAKFPNDPDPEVQMDLRKWADDISKALSAYNALVKEEQK